MRYVVVSVLVMLLAGCTTYFRGERYSCFGPFAQAKCKHPPYHWPPPGTPDLSPAPEVE